VSVATWSVRCHSEALSDFQISCTKESHQHTAPHHPFKFYHRQSFQVPVVGGSKIKSDIVILDSLNCALMKNKIKSGRRRRRSDPFSVLIGGEKGRAIELRETLVHITWHGSVLYSITRGFVCIASLLLLLLLLLRSDPLAALLMSQMDTHSLTGGTPGTRDPARAATLAISLSRYNILFRKILPPSSISVRMLPWHGVISNTHKRHATPQKKWNPPTTHRYIRSSL
jgi:hypothetical protein